MANPESNVSRSMTGVVVHQILVVEDDPATAALIKQILRVHKLNAEIAKDGGQAQSSFVMHKPDLVLLDIMLPGESGFEVCQRLKKTDREVPVVMLSAIDMSDARDLAERVGADAYLTKPVDPDLLISTIYEVAQDNWEQQHQGVSRVTTDEKRLRFYCACGKKFKVSPVHMGKRLTCPDCGETVTVPVRR